MCNLTNACFDLVIECIEADKAPAPALGHILEIFGYDAQDDIFEDLALPAGSKVRRLKAANKEVLGQVLVVFKNATLASEALSTFQEGKSTWMNPEAKLHFESSCSTSEEGESVEATGLEEEDDESSESAAAAVPSTRLQRRFNVKVWTPVLVNSVTPLKATQPQLSSSPSNDSTNSNNNNNNVGSANNNGTARSEDGEERDQEDVVSGTPSSAAVSSSSPTLQKESDPGSVILDSSS